MDLRCCVLFFTSSCCPSHSLLTFSQFLIYPYFLTPTTAPRARQRSVVTHWPTLTTHPVGGWRWLVGFRCLYSM